ncbi:MAG: glycosyltransferase [Clostridia bacterium]|nr:glycosyltransferase [Clostridia bacterium]
MNNMKFSVSMCVYGGDNPDHFRTAIESVFSQTFMPSEVVLVIDGPVPKETDAVICDMQNQHQELKVIRLEKNMGHGVARKTGIKECTHNYIAIADADDINLPDRFALQMQAFEKYPEVNVMSGSHTKFIDNPDNVIAISSRPEHHKEIVALMKKMCPITQACVMFTKEIYEKAGGYVDWYCGEDYYLWIRMYEAGAVFYNCPENLVAVRTSQDQYKRRGGLKYFESTAGLSNYMYKKGIIGLKRHIINVAPRFVLQVILPPSLRGKIRNIVIKNATKEVTKNEKI